MRPIAHGAFVRAPPECEPGVPRRPRRRLGPDDRASGSGREDDISREPTGVFSLAWSWVKLATGVALVVGTSLGAAWGVHRYAVTSPRFAIREVSIQGRKRTTEAELLKLAGIQVGANIFRLEPRRAEAALLENPWIQEAKVVRDLPGKVRIEITEREAVALAAVGEHLYLVTRLGEPFKEIQEGDPYDLPVLTGLTLDGLARSRTAELGRARAALELLSAYGKLPLSRVHVAQEVALTPGGEVVLTVGKAGISLHVGPGPWTTKLIMAERVLGKTAAQGQTPGLVFLDNQSNPERVVVRLR